ncbi:hypothetical protein GCM10011380_08860 [Sphingomonas metalli]|uniref:Phage tail protein n=1 Tax=Sphingomonas metalli TaxID=1779358 RepID=A0A916SX72_9SPHN|nr:hypothetical protein [Sphingomonas metalli]GGB21515.1 hypothetical protein GCM10011380_08860 [Sphingomonas metalli]
MASSTAAGSKLAISAGVPSAQTFAAYGALTYTTIGGIESIGTFGASTEVVNFTPLDGAMEKYKGPTNYGQLQPTVKVDSTDAGQNLVRTAAAPDNNALYAAKIIKPDGSIGYCQVRVFGFPETIGAANSIITAQPVMEINTPILTA